MAQTRVLVAVDPATGARITRRTARTYVAVVVIGDPAQGEAYPTTWCGRPDLAEKALRKFSRPDARLAPVVEDPWAEAEAAPAPAQAEPAPVVAETEAAPVKGCRLMGDARHLFALFARRYRLTPAQCFALQSEVLDWADRVALWCNGQPLAGPFGALTPGLARRGVISVDGVRRAWAPDALDELWAVAQAQAEAEGLRPVPALADARPSATLPGEVCPGRVVSPAVGPVLPGEPEPVAARVAELGPVTLPGEDREAVAALRADAAAGRRVSLASLARALSGAPELPELPTRFSGGGFAGLQPWGNMPGYPQPGANPTAGTLALGCGAHLAP